jgi:hypothetical protein
VVVSTGATTYVSTIHAAMQFGGHVAASDVFSYESTDLGAERGIETAGHLYRLYLCNE